MLNRLCQKAYVPKPEVFISDLNRPNSLAFGRSNENAQIVLSSSLLEKLKPKELEAILALHIADIKNWNLVVKTMWSTILSLIFGFTKLVDWTLFLQIFIPQQKRWMPLTFAISPLVRLLSFAILTKENFYKSDRLASSFLEDDKILAKTLWKLESYTESEPAHVRIDLAHLYAVNPLPKKTWYFGINLQPSYEARIKKLIGYFPI